MSGMFLHRIDESVDINAPASRVFEVITRAQDWHLWSTMLQFRGGEVRVGAKLKLGL